MIIRYQYPLADLELTLQLRSGEPSAEPLNTAEGSPLTADEAEPTYYTGEVDLPAGTYRYAILLSETILDLGWVTLTSSGAQWISGPPATSSGGGEGSCGPLYLLPASAVRQIYSVAGQQLTLYRGEGELELTVLLLDAEREPISVPAGAVFAVGYRSSSTLLQEPTAVTPLEEGGFVVTIADTVTAQATPETGEQPLWSLRDSAGKVLALGPLVVRPAP